MTATRVTCRLCGDPLHQVAKTVTDEFVWVDEASNVMGLDSDLRQLPDGDPYARLKVLSDALLAATAVKTEKASRTWLYWARARGYSSLKTRMDFGGTHHVHWPGPHESEFRGPVPECCGWPGWLRPSGWQCRRCGAALVVLAGAA